MDVDHPYPVLYLPKQCATFEHNFGPNVFLDVDILFNNKEQQRMSLYKGLIALKVIDTEAPANLIPSRSESISKEDISTNTSDRTYIDQVEQQSDVPDVGEGCFCQGDVNIISENAEPVFLHKKFRRSTNRKREDSQQSLQSAETNTSEEKIYQCQNCKQTFDNLKTYREQSTIHKQKTQCMENKDRTLGHNDPNWECPEYFKVLQSFKGSKNSLHSHMLLHSRKLHPMHVLSMNPKTSKKKRRSRICIVCKKRFSKIVDIKQHLIDDVVNQSLAKIPVNAKGSLSIECAICRVATFSRVDYYKAHIRKHAKLTMYKCLLCNKSFSNFFSSNFRKHKKLHAQSLYVCDMCKRKFISKKSICAHMKVHMKAQREQDTLQREVPLRLDSQQTPEAAARAKLPCQLPVLREDFLTQLNIYKHT